MLIPARLRINGREFKVRQPSTLRRAGARGEINYGTAVIQVATHSNISGRKLSAAQRSETFWHEVTHGVLDDLGYHLLNRNEKFVKRFSQGLNNVIRSAKFK